MIGIGLAVVGVSAWWAAVSPGTDDIAEMERVEDRMYEAATEAGMVTPDPEKRLDREDAEALVAE